MLDYRMETFLSLCETKSYTKTAKKLHLTQPSVTQHIKYLEQFYQCELFHYDGRQTEMTKAGKYLYDKTRALRVQEMEIQSRLRGLYEELPLRIGITPSVARTPLIESLCGCVRKDAPIAVNLSVSNTATLMSQLQECQLDAAVLEGDAFCDTQIEAHPLYQERLIIAANPQLARQLYGCTWQQMIRQPLLLPDPGSGLRTILQKRLRSRGLDFHDFKRVWNVNSYDVVIELLRQGQGVAVFMESTIRRELKAHKLERVYLETNSAFCTVYFVTMRSRAEQQELTVLQEHLKPHQEIEK